LIAKNSSQDNKYIQSVKLNGKLLNQVWFCHADIASDGTLELQMGNSPNRSLGTAPESLPPSSALIHPETLTSK
jgi:putative alpha-1,2-mannosidase